MYFSGIIGIGLFLWGLFTLDWTKIVVGIVVWIVGFVYYRHRQKSKLNAILSYFAAITPLIKSLLPEDEKSKLAQALFHWGMADAFEQSAKLNKLESFDLKSTALDMLGLGPAYRDKIFIFFQPNNLGKPAFKAIIAGGKFISQGDVKNSAEAAKTIQTFIQDPSFPKSIFDLKC